MPVNIKNEKNVFKRICKRLSKHRGWGYPDVLQFACYTFMTCVPVLFFTLVFTALVVCLYKIFGYNVVLPEILLNTISLVVAILLGFRVSNAYESYYEGRRLFGSMINEIRNAVRRMWARVPEINESDRREKEKNVKLLLAFAIAVKHHLRFEFGIDWYDLKDLLPEGLQLTSFDGSEVLETDKDLRDANLRTLANRIPPSIYMYLRNSYKTDETTIWFGASEWGNDIDASMSLPLEIIYHLELYINKKQQNSIISENLTCLVDIFGNCERISTFPPPFSHGVHMKQVVLIYVWLLPSALVEQLGWFVIPAVALVGFVIFGLEAIGAEAVNPFGFDPNDLPLDGYVQDLEAEIKYLLRHIPSTKAIASS